MVDLSWETAALEALNAWGERGEVRESVTQLEGLDSTRAQRISSKSHDFSEPLIGGMDEVGRGAIAGPVCVGVTVIGAAETASGFPAGINDSKKLTAKRRLALQDPIHEWVRDFAIGEAANSEIDEFGIMPALQLAGWRALNQLDARGHLPVRLLLDGNIDYLTYRSAPDLFNPDGRLVTTREMQVETLVKGDAKSATIAAAAILAKVYRDEFMRSLEDPGYGWSHNVGYGTKAHLEAIKNRGVSKWHRQTWIR